MSVLAVQMSYTKFGLELTRLALVDSGGHVLMDELVVSHASHVCNQVLLTTPCHDSNMTCLHQRRDALCWHACAL